jgi:RNA polymerase sigma-70 factor (ECF subfamily)
MGQASTSLLDLLRGPGPQPEAWSRFINLYADELLMWARKHGLQPEDAQDVAQSILTNIRELLKAYRREPGKSFGAWLRCVTVNECRQRLRRRTKEGAGAGPLASLADTSEVAPFESAEEAEHERRLLRRAMELARPEFSDKDWSAFTATALDNRPPAEVAAELGTTVGAVYVAKSRVVKHLKELVRDLIEEK